MKELKQKVTGHAKKHITKHASKAKSEAKNFRQEFNKALNTALLAAFGFLIALFWRDVIQEWVNKIAESSPVQGKLISALIVTIVCVVGIILIARIFKVKKE